MVSRLSPQIFNDNVSICEACIAGQLDRYHTLLEDMTVEQAREKILEEFRQSHDGQDESPPC